MPCAYCPHCSLQIGTVDHGRFPRRPMRCPRCRLTIAVGRGRTDEPGARRAPGSAAGVLASAARHETGPAVGPEAVIAAVQRAAGISGAPVQRLRMVDFQRVASAHAGFPPLSSILASGRTWKEVRASAERTE